MAFLGLIGCSYVDPNEPFFLLPDDEFTEDEVAELRRAVDSWNIEFGIQGSVVDERVNGQLRRVVRDDDELCAEGVAGKAGRSDEIRLCQRLTLGPTLFAVAQHEIGHVFGVGHVGNRASVMSGSDVDSVRHFTPEDRKEMEALLVGGLPGPGCETVRWWGYTSAPSATAILPGGDWPSDGLVLLADENSLELRGLDFRTSERTAILESFSGDFAGFRRVEGRQVVIGLAGGEAGFMVQRLSFEGEPEWSEFGPFAFPGDENAQLRRALMDGADLILLRVRGQDLNLWDIIRVDLSSGEASLLYAFSASPGLPEPQLVLVEGHIIVLLSTPDGGDDDPEVSPHSLLIHVHVRDASSFGGWRLERTAQVLEYESGRLVRTRLGLVLGLKSQRRAEPAEFKWLDLETLELRDSLLRPPSLGRLSELIAFEDEERTVLGVVGQVLRGRGPTEAFVATVRGGSLASTEWRSVSPDDDVPSVGLRLQSTHEGWFAHWADVTTNGLKPFARRARCGRW